MKNQNGITMTSLLLYIVSFTVIIAIVGTITVFFDKNMSDLNTSVGTSSEYNKFNLYMLNLTQNGYNIFKSSNEYITFSKEMTEGGIIQTDKNTILKLGNILYYNKIKLCENVDSFYLSTSVAENGKQVIDTTIEINGKTYNTKYVME